MKELATRFREQAVGCRAYGSELTASLLEGAAADLEAGGVMADLMAPHAQDPRGTVPALRFAGAMHRLVLQGRAPQLAAHYPSVGGAAPVAEVWPAAEPTVGEHLEELRTLVRNAVQTNEVGRAAVLFGVLQLLEGPVRLLEVGASAGLNLRADRFAYEVGDDVLGDPASPVRLVQPWQGTAPAYRGVEVVERRGCDPSPLDATSPEGRLTLTSYVWADQVARLDRLKAAIEVAERVPMQVERAGALEFLTRELSRPTDVTTLVWHSVVWQYVHPDERAAVEELLAQAGAELGPRLVRASMEPRKSPAPLAFMVRVQRWPGGESAHVADCHGHGPPVRWNGASMEG
ncbi:MAG TPA: DUF2332 domain-containing protein [Mycobacteriales bacterium]|nr:DUF2332 domain-containing protein [Mycobacteriales bacterium]